MKALAMTPNDVDEILPPNDSEKVSSPVALARARSASVTSVTPMPGAKLLGTWLNDPTLLTPPEIVIPNVAVEGRVTLLSGREKIGKSTFTACIVSAASQWQDVLGVPLVEPVSCLWYALDEAVADTVRRFSNLGANDERILINDQPRTANDLLAALNGDLARCGGVELVVVDNLSRVFALSGVDPNSQKETEPVLAKIVDLFHRLNISAVLLYHTGKGGREYRGSTAIGATVDEVLTLRKRGQGDEDDFAEASTDDGRRLLVMEGRNLRGRVQLVYRDSAYKVFEEAAQTDDRLLATLRDHGVVAGRAELVRLAGVRKQEGLEKIRALIGSGAISESGRQLKIGSYRFPDEGTKPELRKEPAKELGSHSPRVGSTETGTDDRGEAWEPPELPIDDRPRRVNNGVPEVLRRTQHGDRWFPEVA